MSADICRPYPWKCSPKEARIAFDLHRRGLLPIGDDARHASPEAIQRLANSYRNQYGSDPSLQNVIQILAKRGSVR